MPIENKRAARVWTRLFQSYGVRLTESFGKEPPKPWVDAFEALTDEQIGYGLKAVLRESPNHPPTLGQFEQCCMAMPVPQLAKGPTIQEQLCAYATQHVHDTGGPKGMTLLQLGRSWNYVYREWFDATRPKGFERCAECIGLVIEIDDGTRFGWSVRAMNADRYGHAKTKKSFFPGPFPKPAKLDEALANGQL
jgi:hypothetical protein